MRTLATFAISLFRCVVALFRSREEQAIVELALRQQLAVYAQNHQRPRLSPLDRTFWVLLSRLWPSWKNHLVVVRPETVVRWHRDGFRKYWRSISTPGPGRPPIPEETKALILRMATENCWRARKIQAELMKLGIRISLATVSRYVPRPMPDPTQQRRWMTFLRNHKDVIAGMDFFVVPTVRFRLLYVWFAIDPKRTAFRSPWQNGTAERFVGSVRRELLDHVVVMNEDHLRRLLREYTEYYNNERVHTSIGDAPNGRAMESRPSGRAKIIGFPRVGGLHHRYRWGEAA
jgi:hypothetical protein